MFSEVAQLVIRLAEGGFEDEALDLASAVLGVVTPRAAREVEVNGQMVQIRQEPVALLEHWEFDRFLSGTMPTLIARSPEATAQRLAAILDDFLLAEFGEEKRASGRDVSYSWCREVEAPAEQPVFGYKEALVPWLRDAALRAAAGSVERGREVVTELRGHPWFIHSRVAIFTVAETAESSPTLAKELLLDRALFDGLAYVHEYARLAHRTFPLLIAEEQNQYLSWIEEGPGLVTEDEERKDRWRFNRLTAVKDSLPEEARKRYEELLARFGEPDWQADHLTGTFESWVGPTSPLTAAELSERSAEDVITFLRTWAPTREWHAATREGLGRAFMVDVQSRPAEYVARAEGFRDLNPTYARSLLSGLRTAAAQLEGVDLNPVLRLGLRIVEGRVPTPKREATELDLDEGPDWRGSRLELAHLLESLSSEDLVDSAQAAAAVRCTILLLEDADPTQDDEARYGTGMGSVNYSINTVRGEAVHAAASLLDRLRRHGRLNGVTDELKAALLTKLDAEREPSPSVRTALAMHFLSLVEAQVADRERLSEALFTDDHTGREAWTGFLRFTRLGAATVEVVFPVLKRALTAPEWQQSEESLSQSLRLAMALHVGGFRAPEDVLEILWAGWEAASVQVRASTVYPLSQDLKTVQAEVPVRVAELVDRMLDYAERHRGEKEDEKRADLEAIGTVLVSERVPIEWVIETLNRLLALDSLVTDLEEVLKRVADAMAREDLQDRVLACLEGVVRVDSQNWGVYAAREPIAAILRAGHASGDQRIRERAEALQRGLLSANRFNPDWLE